jgi:hypothetical protein
MVRAAAVGISGSLRSTISLSRAAASSTAAGDAAGSPIETTSTPIAAMAWSRARLSAIGGFSADALWSPSRSVSSTTSVREGA